jgi:hypothetical protein
MKDVLQGQTSTSTHNRALAARAHTARANMAEIRTKGGARSTDRSRQCGSSLMINACRDFDLALVLAPQSRRIHPTIQAFESLDCDHPISLSRLPTVLQDPSDDIKT